MESRYHALLIGIDAYNGAGVSLNGCVNDIDAVQRLLIDHVGVKPEAITRLAAPRFETTHETDVSEKKPTRENILAAFEDLGKAVNTGDRVFIYYSGHGIQVPIRVDDEERGVREAIVPSDNIVDGERRYVFDWELNARLQKIATQTNAISFILDCCHSAGATRGDLTPVKPGGRDRFLPRPKRSFKLSAAQARDLDGVAGVRDGILQSVQTCQVVAACLDDERARESLNDDDDHEMGELTRAFVARCKSRKPAAGTLSELRWGEIWYPMRADILRASPTQHPWISGDFGRRVFGGPPERGDAGYPVAREGNIYRLGAGTLAEITTGATLAVYGGSPQVFDALGSSKDVKARLGMLRVTSTERMSATAVAATKDFTVPPDARARLVTRGAGVAPLLVAVAPSDGALEKLIEKSAFLRVARAAERAQADVTLVRRGADLVLTDALFGTGEHPGDAVLFTLPSASQDKVVRLLEHYYDYSRAVRFAKNCADLPGQLQLKVLDCTGATLSPAEAQAPSLPECPRGTRATYEVKRGTPVCFRVENNSEEKLFVSLLDCQPDGSVALLGEGTLGAGKTRPFWNKETPGRPFIASLPAGLSVGLDRMVAIGRTNRDASLKFLEVSDTFEKALRGASRNFGDGASPEQWAATTRIVRVVS